MILHGIKCCKREGDTGLVWCHITRAVRDSLFSGEEHIRKRQKYVHRLCGRKKLRVLENKKDVLTNKCILEIYANVHSRYTLGWLLRTTCTFCLAPCRGLILLKFPWRFTRHSPIFTPRLHTGIFWSNCSNYSLCMSRLVPVCPAYLSLCLSNSPLWEAPNLEEHKIWIQLPKFPPSFDLALTTLPTCASDYSSVKWGLKFSSNRWGYCKHLIA